MKIDISKIDGYEDMTTEEKLKALEGLELPEPDYTGYIKKETFDKTASELAAKKRELNAKLSEEEQNKQREREEREELQRKFDALMHETTVSKNKAKLLALGYDDKLADDTAEAMVAGDLETVIVNQKKYLDSFEKKIRAEVLKDTPKPTGEGETANVMTLEKLKKMSPAERFTYSRENPEIYKELYQGGN